MGWSQPDKDPRAVPKEILQDPGPRGRELRTVHATRGRCLMPSFPIHPCLSLLVSLLQTSSHIMRGKKAASTPMWKLPGKSSDGPGVGHVPIPWACPGRHYIAGSKEEADQRKGAGFYQAKGNGKMSVGDKTRNFSFY